MRKLILASLFAVAGLTCSAFGQAADNCGSAPTVGEGTFPYDLAGATNDFAGTCGGTGTAQDVWYRYVASACGTATVSTCGLTGGDSVLLVLDACGGTVIGCVDDSCGLQTTITFDVGAGQDYFIRIADFGGGVHAGSIAISIAPVFPANDECTGAFAIGLGSTAYDTVCATRSGTSPCGGLGSDLWYSYTSTCDGTLTATTCSPNRNYDTVLAAYDGCGGNLIQCNDDGPPSCTIPGVPFSGSTVSFAVTAGSTTLFRVGGFNGARGVSELTLSFAAASPPSNDECTGAIPIGAGTIAYNNGCATTSPASPCGGLGSDLWYSYFAPCAGTLTATTCSPVRTHDTVLAAYDGCGGNLIQCNDDGPPFCGNPGVPFSGSTVSFAVAAGSTTFFRVGGFQGSRGSGEFTVSLSSAPSNDSCRNAAAVGNGVTPYTNACATTDGPAACGGLGSDVWFLYTAPSSCFTTVTTCSSNRNYDTVLAVYRDGCGGSLIDCNDDGPPFCGNPGVPFSGSTVRFDAVAGSTYLIRVGGFNGARGSSDLTITQSARNDNCADAIAIGLGTVPYNNICATTDGPQACGGLGNDIWYSYTAPNAAQITATTCSPNRNYDTVMAVYDGPCGGAQVGCNDDGPPFCGLPGVPFSGSTVVFNPVAGNQYLIRVGGFLGARGSSDLTLSRSCHGGCTADFDDGSSTNSPDGGVTIDDLLYYLVIFRDGVTCADIDDGSGTGTPDGGVTIDDLLYFIQRFTAGC